MLKIKSDYGKAIVKKGDVYMMQERWQEALNTYNTAKECKEPPAGLREKLREATLEIKKAKRKNYYKILGVDKNVGETELRKKYKRLSI